MLISKSFDEWENSYKSAAHVLKDMPLKLEKLNDIHNRPQYYAGYYCRNIPGNLGMKGSVSSEANHSSIISHFGDSGAWSIVYHINKLMEKQDYFIGMDTKKEIIYS